MLRRTVSPFVIMLLMLAACTNDAPKPATRGPETTADVSQAPLVEVPDVTNQRYRLVERAIVDAGLEIGAIERVGDGTKNIVLEQHPPAGTEVPTGTPISIIVSKVFPVPLLSIPGVGSFGWTCRANKIAIRFTVEEHGASTYVIRSSADGSLPAIPPDAGLRWFSSPPGRRMARLIHPGQTLRSLGSAANLQRWILVQGTEPRTVRSDISIMPQRSCQTYVPPEVSLEMQARSHSVL